MNGSKTDKKVSGISLIEVLVAFVILSLSVTVLFRIFSSGTTNIIISQQYVDAVQIAESQLAKAGITSELVPSINNGFSGEKYTWQTTVEPHDFYDYTDQEIYPVNAYRVVVEVKWKERGHTRQIQLNAIKLQQINTTGRPG